ncbi:MAG TPA: ABC transporter ATP-binding protein [Ktedonobacteraceae bacterium]|nr:ABC transporter ATP-binding protein [Ktedonobacteraceae bacterium]
MQSTGGILVSQQNNTDQLPQQTMAAAPVSPIITVEHLVKRYKREETNAVDDISFTVAAGSLFALLGPNGAGKTTTISILTTTLAPTSGTVLIAGYNISQQAKAVRDTIGIIFQKPSLDLNLTAEENIRFHATLYGLYPFRPSYRMMPRAYREQVEQLSTILGIREDLFRSVKTYSGGMKRKLEILRSLLHQPRVLFLDEPTAGLDPSSRRNLWDYLRLVRQENGTTVFLTTHYLEEAEQAESICMMNKGKIVACGTPTRIKAELIEEYLLIDAEDRAALREELTRLHLPFTEMPQFRLPLKRADIHATLKAIETPLTSVQTHTPTLEDAYLEIVGGQ